jgi:hypothetical protein
MTARAGQSEIPDVVPAQAGTRVPGVPAHRAWIPACAGMTTGIACPGRQ